MTIKIYRIFIAVIVTGIHGKLYADHPSIAFGAGSAGPINTISAQPMPKGILATGLRTEIIDNNSFTDLELEQFAERDIEGVHSVDEIRNTTLSLAYGLSNRFSISARIPYIERTNIREIEHQEAHLADEAVDPHDVADAGSPVHSHGSSSGFGDAVLLGQYSTPLVNAAELALLFGVKAPTGDIHVKDADGERFETEMQPGSGSWDFLVGTAVSKSTENLGYHAAIFYSRTTEGAQSTEIGDALSYGVAVTYSPHSHGNHAHGETHHHHDNAPVGWNFMVELHGETRDKKRISGHVEGNTGGTLVFLSPGIRATIGGVNASLSLGLPVISNLNGEQTDADYRIVAGMSLGL